MDYLIIKSLDNITGNATLMNADFPVASLFKIILSFAALKSGVIHIDEELNCADRLEKTGKLELNMREALFYSSNDYFKQLATKLPPRKLIEAMQELKFPSNIPTESELQNEWDDIWRGASIKVSPAEVFSLTARLAQMFQLDEHTLFFKALERLDPHDKIKVFGKTGTWGGAAWCTGFSLDSKTGKAITVATSLFQYEPPNWQAAHERAIQECYQALGL